MSSKYKVVALAYKDINPEIEFSINQSAIKTLRLLNDFNETYSYCSCRGFNLNDRLCIYLDWFKNEIKEKIEEGYIISILEIPINSSDAKLDSLRESHLVYGHNLLIIDVISV